MKTKLRLLFFALMLTVSFAHAQKTDVWDLGAVELDTNLYNNNLTVAIINSWFPGVTAGTAGPNLPTAILTLTPGVLTLTTGGSDRLYVSATNPNVNNITRTATGNTGTTDPNYTARYYCNGAANNAATVATATSRFFTLTLDADDEVTVIASTESAGNSISVSNMTTSTQNETFPVTTSGAGVTSFKFVAKEAGNFKIVSLVGKGNYYRIYRKHVAPLTLTGNVSAATGIPAGYSILFTNTFTGKTYTAPVTSGAYSVVVPSGYTYKMSLVNASGFIISNGETFTVTDATTITHDISILKVDLYTVSGTVTGLGTKISSAAFTYTPTVAKVYVPKPIITTATSTYTVDLEASTQYTITATGVNDYEILANTITIPTANTTADIAFTAKPVYPITINTTGLDATQLSNLKLTFTNLNESGYVYNFNSVTGITLRDGTYSVAYSGLENYPVDCGTISNLKVTGAAVSKTIDFRPVTVWSFEDRTVSTTTAAGYKGMLVTGGVSNRIGSGDLTAKTGATIKIPVKNIGDKVLITYYYAANFSIEGGTAITTASNSTSIFENVEYTYTGTEVNPGYVTLTLGGSALTSYFTNIQIGGGNLAYSPVLTVGAGKNYPSINEALTAISFMTRTNTQRVTIMIDPGNYEEMIDITQANVTLKNAATTPNIKLLNEGVDIDAGAVRITSYYGVGYNYYSMKNNQKWDADVLRVNKENGSQPYTNKSGTDNNSYWNATLIVSANGFIAEDIIIENSYNQYVSLKESQDVVELSVGNKGVRPTTYRSTAVQNKSFVERAAAIAVKNNIDKVVLNKCRVVGRQDSFFGGSGARVVVYKGVMMGATDYLFGGMNAVFYQTDLAMNTSPDSNDVSYLTAAQQTTGRGYLMYECKVTSAVPGTETASPTGSKPGYFGRPWAANTSEVVFYNTTIETSSFPTKIGESLIIPQGWNNTLSGESPKMYEYGTIENSGVDNSASRASWATKLATPILTDITDITTFNFTKGTDNWDPLPLLISNETLGIKKYQPNSSAVTVVAYKNNVAVSNVTSTTNVSVYSISGALIKSFHTDTDTTFNLNTGIWIVVVKAADGQKAVKVITY